MQYQKSVSLKLLVLIILFSFTSHVQAQSWQEVSSEEIELKGEIDISVDDARIYKINDSEIKNLLWNAPHESDVIANAAKGQLIKFPISNGNEDLFYVYQYDMMAEELAKKYSDIRTFIGISRAHPDRKIRIDYTSQGVRAVIRDAQGMTYIDHYQRKDKEHRIVYKRSSFQTDKKVDCGVGLEKLDFKPDSSNGTQKLLGECELKTYRYAQTATGEYSNFHGATSSSQSALVLSAITTTMNRVNEVYEQDLTVRFELIGNTDALFYYDPVSDPFNGSNASNMINANQTNTDAIIGSANYDIGHIFSTGGSGLAGLNVVCSNGNKARGVTGIGTPAGDPFDIDYVSHEIGHQCGGNHTQNNPCNRSGTSVEVGSGYTIMGYAGICAPNVLNNSIAMFNAANIIEMSNYLNTRTCHVPTSIANSTPIIQAIEDKTIPPSTPFILDVEVSDPDTNVIYHSWEQQDSEVATMPPVSTNTGGPTFRSYLPKIESERYYPPISDYSQGISNTWEVLPSVGRELNFLYTARDMSFTTGCIDTASVKITIDGNSNPFDVISQSTAESYLEYENVLITWDVANTNVAPINAQFVDILYSRDGGLTYPDTLVKQTLNDGMREVVIPGGLENDVRFMVKAFDNYFFDINDVDCSVTDAGASFDISLDDVYENICTTEPNPHVVTISLEAFEGFVGATSLSLLDVPAGLTATLNSNAISEGTPVLMTLENFDIPSGIYTILIQAERGAISRTEEFVLEILDTNNASVSLVSPANAEVDVVNNPVIEWLPVNAAIEYEYEILNSAGTVIESNYTSSTSVIVSSLLGTNQSFSWRVRAIFLCGNGGFSAENTFSTGTCLNYQDREDLVIPATISTVSTTLNVPFNGTVTDVNIKDLDITHSWIADLEITLGDPNGNSAILYDNTCGDDDDIFLTYDDAGSAFSCADRTSGNTVQPAESLSVFNTANTMGNWELEITDIENQDGGVLNSWTLEICYESTCELNVDKLVYDDGSGSLKDALECAASGDVITFDTSLPAVGMINMGVNPVVIDKNITLSVPTNREIVLLGTSTTPSIEILSTGVLTANNLTVENTTTTQEVVNNEGTLSINNVTIISSPTAVGINNINGVLNASGTNSVEKN